MLRRTLKWQMRLEHEKDCDEKLLGPESGNRPPPPELTTTTERERERGEEGEEGAGAGSIEIVVEKRGVRDVQTLSSSNKTVSSSNNGRPPKSQQPSKGFVKNRHRQWPEASRRLPEPAGIADPRPGDAEGAVAVRNRYSQAWGSAILAGLSFFALGWFIKGGNPLPSLSNGGGDSSNRKPSSGAADTPSPPVLER